VLPEIYLVAADLPGNLFIMPCPTGDHLTRDIDAYRTRGLDTVVSMLPVEEAAMLGLGSEEATCARAGIIFLSSPIRDFGLPEIVVFDALVQQIADMLRDGKHVAVHCRAGIGRSGMATAATLIALGLDAGSAVRQVTQARGGSIPDTVEQGRFIADYEVRSLSNNT
tara:strand:- start:2147 stop:2647 length:501 start_codon:yes stop_codon:yes gene_type:complete